MEFSCCCKFCIIINIVLSFNNIGGNFIEFIFFSFTLHSPFHRFRVSCIEYVFFFFFLKNFFSSSCKYFLFLRAAVLVILLFFILLFSLLVLLSIFSFVCSVSLRLLNLFSSVSIWMYDLLFFVLFSQYVFAL